MAGYAEAFAELPTPFNIPFKVWLKLPEMARGIVALLILYPIVAFLSVVTVFQILSYWVDMQPVQRYALRGLGIDTQNLIDTSGVIDTVSLETFQSDVSKSFNSIFIKRGQTVALVVQAQSDSLRPAPACLVRPARGPSEGTKIGSFAVSIVRSNFHKDIPLLYSSDRQLSTVISSADWGKDPSLEGFDSNDDVRVNIEYKSGEVYDIPADATDINRLDARTPAGVQPYLACRAYSFLMNIRIAKPELLLSN